jgi:hypothetical protein
LVSYAGFSNCQPDVGNLHRNDGAAAAAYDLKLHGRADAGHGIFSKGRVIDLITVNMRIGQNVHIHSVPTTEQEEVVPDLVRFAIEYKDGFKVLMAVKKEDVHLGDDAASIIAKERQRQGHLPDGRIKRITREHVTAQQ